MKVSKFLCSIASSRTKPAQPKPFSKATTSVDPNQHHSGHQKRSYQTKNYISLSVDSFCRINLKKISRSALMRLLISLHLSTNIKIAKISITEKEIGPKQLLSRESIERREEIGEGRGNRGNGNIEQRELAERNVGSLEENMIGFSAIIIDKIDKENTRETIEPI